MKRMTMILAVLLALPLFAGEQEQEKTKPAAGSTDSPLVAAAKKTNRAKPKSIVITNHTVKTSTGHITTTTNSRIPIIPEPAPSSEVKYNEERAKAKVEAAKKAAEDQEKEKKRQVEMAKASAKAEHGEYGTDAEEVVPPPVKP